MEKDIKKALNYVSGKGHQGSIQSNPVNNENGSLNPVKDRDDSDPVDSSDSRKKNPKGQEGHGVHAKGSKTTRPEDPKDPVNRSSKSETKSKGEVPKDRTVDSNGVKQPHTELHNNTRKISDKPNGKAKDENHITDIASGTKHNDTELGDTEAQATKSLSKRLDVAAKAIGMLDNHFLEMKGYVNGQIDMLNKHMTQAQRGGMFYSAEHAPKKKRTSEEARAINTATRCHHSHKNMSEASNADKGLAANEVSAAKAGNTSALAKDNYKMDKQSKNAKKAHKSVDTTSKAAVHDSLADCDSMMASAKEAGDDSKVSACDSMMRAMKSGKAAKAEMANMMKGVNEGAKASLQNLSANSSSRPKKKSSDVDEESKSVAASEDHATKSMPQGKASDDTKPTKAEKSVKPNTKKSDNSSDSVNKSLDATIAKNPQLTKNMSQNVIATINKTVNDVHSDGFEAPLHRAWSYAHKALLTGNYGMLQKSINLYNDIDKKIHG